MRTKSEKQYQSWTRTPSSHLVSALKSIYGCSYFILLILKKNCYTTKSTFWVLAYYTTSSINGVGETRSGQQEPTRPGGLPHTLGFCVGFSASWYPTAC